MTLRRLYAPALPEQGGLVILDEAPAHHARVLRLCVGDEVELFDGRGLSAVARIELAGDEWVCRASPPTRSEAPSVRLVLMLAVPKGSTLDDCVRMSTELGVDEIALLKAARSVPRWDGRRAQSRKERLIRVASEAAGQSERTELPLIRGPRTCEAWLDEVSDGDVGIVFDARSRGVTRIVRAPERVWCVVGPEGGFCEAELGSFRAAGFAVASLGRWVLRVDTAVASALTLVQDRLAALQPR